MSDPVFPCPVQTCTHGKDGGAYVGTTEKARALHIQKRHSEELRPLPNAPAFAPILAPKRAAIYLRVSTVDQHPENQLPGVRTFCGLRGYEVIAQYVDKASGKDMDRPDLRRMLADSVSHPRPFDVVVFRRMSRLGRSLRDNIALFDHFQALGIAMVSVEEPYDTTSPSGRLIRNIMASVHEYERESTLEQAQEGIARRRAEGKYVGRHPAGCGIPRELGGLGPCPDGVEHKGMAKDLIEKAAQRQAWRDRKRRSREAKAQAQSPLARVTTPPATATHLSDGDTAPAEGV